MNNSIYRLERAVNTDQPVMFDMYEARALLEHIQQLHYNLDVEKNKYQDLMDESLVHSKEIVGGLLKATLEGCIKNGS